MAKNAGTWSPTASLGERAKAAVTGATAAVREVMFTGSGNGPSRTHNDMTWLCRWRTYLRPDVKHPHLEPFTEWEAAVIVQAQREMGNNWLGEWHEPQTACY
eukprot:GHUV01051269.1.p2 GENE.GHUV01051269.1~~GHUV01051269.1.p2  ORF type:complete len:102 (+),score=17.19 GHUV01051269.1:124-429(+)